MLNYLDESTPIQAGDFLEVPGEAGRMQMDNFQEGGEVEQVQTKKPSPGPSLPIMGKSAIPDSGMKQKNFIQNAPKPSVGKMPAGAMQGQKKSAKNIRKIFSQGGGKKMMRPQGGIASMRKPQGGGMMAPPPGQQAQPQQPSGGAGGQWSVQAVATHGGTGTTDTIHVDVSTAGQVGIHSAGEIYFRFGTAGTTGTTDDCVVANDLKIPADTLTFITVPRALGSTIYFNHLGIAACAVRIVLV